MRLIPPELGNGWRPGDERQGEGSVPVLDISDASHDLVAAEHNDALDSGNETMLLGGAVLQFDHADGPATVHVGGSTLWEAATEVVTCVGELGTKMPTWVASTDGQLAAIVAEHFTVDGYSTCDVIALSEVVQS